MRSLVFPKYLPLKCESGHSATLNIISPAGNTMTMSSTAPVLSRGVYGLSSVNICIEPRMQYSTVQYSTVQ